MFRNWPVSWYVMFGLLAWGLPATVLLGPRAIAYSILAILPIAIISWHERQRLLNAVIRDEAEPKWLSADISIALMAAALLFTAYDAAFGKQMLSQNLFLNPHAVDVTIDKTDTGLGKGRSLVNLIGDVMLFMPFVLVDLARRSQTRLRPAMLAVAAWCIFYQSGSSRGMLLMSAFALFAGSGRLTWGRMLIGGFLALGLYQLASIMRGDIANVQYSNPMADSVIWPFINLGLLNDAACGNGSVIGFIGQFLQKFLPGFLINKSVFSFNVEMTLCIYPSDTGSFDSVSIYTWLGEIIYYQPSLVVAVVAGIIAAVELRLVDAVLNTLQLPATRIFVGLICVYMLRSRVQDIYSHLLLVLMFCTPILLPRFILLAKAMRLRIVPA
jgi:hypothetical protein